MFDLRFEISDLRFEMSVLNLLAIGFVTPALLGWLALAAVPVLIHWLFRRRYREVSWGAMQFLHEAVRKQSRRTRLEQLLLLAARILVLVLLVLALARPQWADANKIAIETPPTLHILVLDVSLSMGRAAEKSSAGKTLFEIAKGAAKELVRRSASGDRFLLARICGSEPRVLIRQPTLATTSVLDEIELLPLTLERGDAAATLASLPEVIDVKQPREQCEVVVISDFQADNWPVLRGKESSETWRRLADKASIVLIEVGSTEPDNATVQSIVTDPPIISAEQPMTVTATIRNNGSVPIVGRRIELLIDDQLVDSRRIDVPLGQDSTAEFTLMAPASGEHGLVVRLEEDSLPADNQRWLSLTVRSELNVLLVNGRTSGRARDAATFFVEQALSPSSSERGFVRGAENSRGMRVSTVTEADLPNLELNRHDVVFLCDVGTLTEVDVERMRRFVQAGGGLIMSLGPSVLIERSNDITFGSRGLMPVRLVVSVIGADAEGMPSLFGFDPGDYQHPILREFRGNPGAGLETALIRQYVRAELVSGTRQLSNRDDDVRNRKQNAESTNASGVGKQVRIYRTSSNASGGLLSPRDNETLAIEAAVETALRFSSGDPAILTQSRGTGRCVLITTSLDEAWGEWVIWAPGFVPLVHELVQFAAAGRVQSCEHLVGESVVRAMRNSIGDGVVTLVRPNGERQRLPVQDVDGTPTIAFRDTMTPGLYSLSSETAPNDSERIAINFDPRESDPRRLDQMELSPQMSASSVVFRDAMTPSPPEKIVDAVANDVARGLLVAVLALLLIEQGLAWRFTAGVVVAMVASVWLTTGWQVALLIVVAVCVFTRFNAFPKMLGRMRFHDKG